MKIELVCFPVETWVALCDQLEKKLILGKKDICTIMLAFKVAGLENCRTFDAKKRALN